MTIKSEAIYYSSSTADHVLPISCKGRNNTIVLASGLIALLGGAVVALGKPVFILIFLAVIASVLILFKPKLLLWVILIGALVLSGLAELYLPSLKLVRWGVVLVAIGLAVESLIINLTSKSEPIASTVEHNSILIWALLFFLFSVFSALLNEKLSINAISGLKGYFQVWAVLLAFIWLRLKSTEASRYIKSLLWLSLLQVPFALHQYFFLVPLRLSKAMAEKDLVVAVDVVAGTFGASLSGGGGSQNMAVLQVISIALVWALYRIGSLSVKTASILSLIFFLPLILNETKITFFILPLALALIFQDRLLRNFFKTVATVVLIGSLMIALAIGYTLLPRAGSQKDESLSKLVEHSMAYNFGNTGYGGLLLNRSTVYAFWFKQNIMNGSIKDVLIGHGPGATNTTPGLSTHTLAIDNYAGVGIGLTGIDGLLWEVGVLGTLAVIGLFISSYFTAGRLANKFAGSEQWALLKSGQAGIALVGVNLLHDNSFLFDISLQALFILLLGYIVYMSKQPVAL
jgi:hypothetical protein